MPARRLDGIVSGRCEASFGLYHEDCIMRMVRIRMSSSSTWKMAVKCDVV